MATGDAEMGKDDADEEEFAPVPPLPGGLERPRPWPGRVRAGAGAEAHPEQAASSGSGPGRERHAGDV